MKLREPNKYTHRDDARIEIANLIIVLISVASIPIFLLMILSDSLLVLSIEFLFLVGFMDLILTADMLNRGYREQNFYRFFFSHLGNRDGFRVTVVINCAFRAVICFVFLSQPVVILMCALSTFVGPLWNALHAFSFRDDIVLTVPTEVKVGIAQIEVDAGNKVRLEQRKDGSESE
ncbi:MAG: hypothetical protein M1368_00015 [Thaumarchaeota archaeon]|nr:hypothetical protein [Nitrososphaerota archaeon]